MALTLSWGYLRSTQRPTQVPHSWTRRSMCIYACLVQIAQSASSMELRANMGGGLDILLCDESADDVLSNIVDCLALHVIRADQ